MSITFNELISQQFLTTFDVKVPGIGQVELHQISSERAFELTRNVAGLRGEELELFVSAAALSFVKGESPTDAEVTAFRANVTPASLTFIFQKGLDSGVDVLEDLEATEKN